ncbi:GfdT protein [Rhodovulum sulfidophilum]|uniref:GfdT protein n=1 Tax=Rhodovulum sulfidophilum TaxID=35806 RepID=A0A0D6B221_RHOSU|nr:GfdT protein [Rhodovulum sulfidophilum]
MDRNATPARTLSRQPPLVREAVADSRDTGDVGHLRRGLGPGPFALITLFVSPDADFAAVMAGAQQAYPDVSVTGCTTAGEIGPEGYAEGAMVALALPAVHFRAETMVIENLAALDPQTLIGEMIRRRVALARAAPGWPQDFAFLMVDGLSLCEDALTSAILAGLGTAPLIGGSAGDGTRFGRTLVGAGGRAFRSAAVLSFVRTDCAVRAFSHDHLMPGRVRMVVTAADPKRRIVQRINAEPAAREYARLLGKDPNQLSPLPFAAHPVVVRIGGRHHVRAIQRVAENGDLVFFSAIDEGLVLTLAEALPMADRIEAELAGLARHKPPDVILGCDCVLRRIEAEERQLRPALSRILARHRVRGFSTYGEQISGLHVNQTLTGLAIYPPPASGPDPEQVPPCPTA